MDTVGRILETKEVSMKWLKRLIWQWNQEGREIVEYNDSPVASTKRARLSIRGSNDIDADEGSTSQCAKRWVAKLCHSAITITSRIVPVTNCMWYPMI
jgi:hypothetical protein